MPMTTEGHPWAPPGWLHGDRRRNGGRHDATVYSIRFTGHGIARGTKSSLVDRIGAGVHRSVKADAAMTRPARRAISASVRFRVLSRDGFTCKYCGAKPPCAVLEVDHVIPVASGGTNAIGNLVTCCEACNLGKGARPLSAECPGEGSV